MDLLKRIWKKNKLEQKKKPYVSKYVNFTKKNIEMVALLYVNIVTLCRNWKFSCVPKLQNIFFSV